MLDETSVKKFDKSGSPRSYFHTRTQPAGAHIICLLKPPLSGGPLKPPLKGEEGRAQRGGGVLRHAEHLFGKSQANSYNPGRTFYEFAYGLKKPQVPTANPSVSAAPSQLSFALSSCTPPCGRLHLLNLSGALLERANISYPPLQIVPIGSPLRGSQWERGMERNKLTCSWDRRRPGPCRPRCRCTSRSSW